MNEQQKAALLCAMADLIGAVQVHDACDPMVELDADAVRQSIDDLVKAFPEIDFNVPEDL